MQSNISLLSSGGTSMNVRKFLNDAMEKGEQIRGKFVGDLLRSRFVNQLLKNEKFLNGVVGIINAKSGVEKTIQGKMNHVLKIFEVPTRDEVKAMERKIHKLEGEIESLQRFMLSQKLKNKSQTKSRSSAKR